MFALFNKTKMLRFARFATGAKVVQPVVVHQPSNSDLFWRNMMHKY